MAGNPQVKKDEKMSISTIMAIVCAVICVILLILSAIQAGTGATIFSHAIINIVVSIFQIFGR